MTQTPRTAATRVPTAVGELRALIHRANRGDHLLPGVVLVDGAGEGTADGWGGWPNAVAGCGGADTSVPVARSAANLSQLLPASPQHALAIFPGGDHNLFVTERDNSVPLGRQLAPGFMPMLDAWLSAT